MIYNPSSFVAVIQCGCTDVFKSAYPQCLDCFIQTDQCEEYLGVPSREGASPMLVELACRVCLKRQRGSRKRSLLRHQQRPRRTREELTPSSHSLDGLRNVCGLGSALIGGVAVSQSSAGLTYMHTGEIRPSGALSAEGGLKLTFASPATPTSTVGGALGPSSITVTSAGIKQAVGAKALVSSVGFVALLALIL